MPKIVGTAARVVDGDSFSIDEFVGNVASMEDRISIARVQISDPTAEPWLTLGYDEWICVTEGRILLEHAGGTLEVNGGATVFIGKGERFRPSFPEGDTEYFAVCLPAFRPDRCLRENDTSRESDVSKKLQELHAAAGSLPAAVGPEVLYHMCPAPAWEAAKKAGVAYFPATYEADGHYTHATGVSARLIETANHFYQADPHAWVCLRMTRSALRRCGIHVRDEMALPVGDKLVGEGWGAWVCPHIIGGIPLSVVDAEFLIRREGPRFASIPGVVD